LVDALAPPLVVIVEDDEFAAFLFKQALTAHGYAVIVSRGDDESLVALPDLRPAALLVDLHLGDLDGLDLLRRLRSQRALRYVPAAVITGDYFTDANVTHEMEALGIDLHLKPIWEDELLRVVDGLLRRAPLTVSTGETDDYRRPRHWSTAIN
jgi:DNA-binding response OmpR family regulator